MKFRIQVILLLICLNSLAQTNSELLIYNQKWSGFEEVRFAYKLNDKIIVYEEKKKQTDYVLVIDNFELKKLYNNEIIGGLVMVKKEGKYGYYNNAGKKVIPLEYEFAKPITTLNSNGEPNIFVKKNGLMGAVNSKNKPVLAFEYNTISNFNSNRAACIKDNKYFYLDQNLNRISPVDYDKAFSFMPNQLAPVVLNNKMGLIDTNGKVVLPIQYDEFNLFEDDWYNYFEIKNNDLVGVVDSMGKVIIPVEYNSVSILPAVKDFYREFDPYHKKELDIYKKLKNKGYFVCIKEDKQFLLNNESKQVLPSDYKDFTYIGNNNIRATNSENKMGSFKLTGEIFIPFIYLDLGYFAFNRILIQSNSKKYGFLKEDGSECAFPIYYKAFNFSDFDYGYIEFEYDNGEIREGYIGKNCLHQLGRVIYDSLGKPVSEEESKKYLSNSNNASVNKTNTALNRNKSSISSNDKIEQYSGQVYFHFDSYNKSKGERLYIHYGANASYKTSTTVGSDASIKCESGKVYYSFSGDKKDMILITDLKPSDCKKKFYSRDFVK